MESGHAPRYRAPKTRSKKVKNPAPPDEVGVLYMVRFSCGRETARHPSVWDKPAIRAATDPSRRIRHGVGTRRFAKEISRSELLLTHHLGVRTTGGDAAWNGLQGFEESEIRASEKGPINGLFRCGKVRKRRDSFPNRRNYSFRNPACVQASANKFATVPIGGMPGLRADRYASRFPLYCMLPEKTEM